MLPAGLKLQQKTKLVWPSRVRRRLPVAASHSMSVLSSDAEHRYFEVLSQHTSEMPCKSCPLVRSSVSLLVCPSTRPEMPYESCPSVRSSVRLSQHMPPDASRELPVHPSVHPQGISDV
jgi:hypothetical protein